MVVAVLFSRNAPAAASLRQSRAAAATSAPLSPTAAARGGGGDRGPRQAGPVGPPRCFRRGGGDGKRRRRRVVCGCGARRVTRRRGAERGRPGSAAHHAIAADGTEAVRNRNDRRREERGRRKPVVAGVLRELLAGLVGRRFACCNGGTVSLAPLTVFFRKCRRFRGVPAPARGERACAAAAPGRATALSPISGKVPRPLALLRPVTNAERVASGEPSRAGALAASPGVVSGTFRACAGTFFAAWTRPSRLRGGGGVWSWCWCWRRLPCLGGGRGGGGGGGGRRFCRKSHRQGQGLLVVKAVAAAQELGKPAGKRRLGLGPGRRTGCVFSNEQRHTHAQDKQAAP